MLKLPAKVLLVDDTEPHRYALARELERAGHTVRQAADGTEALQLARELPPDVVLLDVNLPDINGFEVCRQLKADPSTSAVPVIFISATCPPWVGHDEATAVGAATFLIHPVGAEELSAIIAGTIQKARRATTTG